MRRKHNRQGLLTATLALGFVALACWGGWLSIQRAKAEVEATFDAMRPALGTAKHGDIGYDPWNRKFTINDIFLAADGAGAPIAKIGQIAFYQTVVISSEQLSAQRIEIKNVEFTPGQGEAVRIDNIVAEDVGLSPLALAQAISRMGSQSTSTSEVVRQAAEAIASIQVGKIEIHDINFDQQTTHGKLTELSLNKLEHGRASELIFGPFDLTSPQEDGRFKRIALKGLDIAGLLRQSAQFGGTDHAPTPGQLSGPLTSLDGVEMDDFAASFHQPAGEPDTVFRIESLAASWPPPTSPRTAETGAITINGIFLGPNETAGRETKVGSRIGQVAFKQAAMTSSGQLSAQRIELKSLEFSPVENEGARVNDVVAEDVSFSPISLAGAALMMSRQPKDSPELLRQAADAIADVRMGKIEVHDIDYTERTDRSKLTLLSVNKLEHGQASELACEGIDFTSQHDVGRLKRLSLKGLDIATLLRKSAQLSEMNQPPTPTQASEFLTTLNGIEIDGLNISDSSPGPQPAGLFQIRSMRAAWQPVATAPASTGIAVKGTFAIDGIFLGPNAADGQTQKIGLRIGKIAFDEASASYEQFSARRIEIKNLEFAASDDEAAKVDDLVIEDMSLSPPALQPPLAPDRMSGPEGLKKAAEAIAGFQIGKIEVRDVNIEKPNFHFNLATFSLDKLERGKISELNFGRFDLASERENEQAKRIVLRGIDVAGLLRQSAALNGMGQPPTPNQVGELLTVFNGFEIEDLTAPDTRLGAQSGDTIHIDSMQASWGQFIGTTPTSVRVTVKAAIPILSSDDGPLKALREAGHNSYSFTLDIGVRWIESDQTYVIAPALVGLDNLFSVSAMLVITNVPPTAFSSDDPDALDEVFALLGVGTIELSLHDTGGVSLLLGQAAKNQNVTVEAARKAFIDDLYRQALSEKDIDMLPYLITLSQFIETPGATLKVVITPKGRITLVQALQTLKTVPDGLLSQFDIQTTVTH
jgi:hypothetical protein